ncbi:ABC transporter permease [Xylanibacter oryzae]|uniref:ABC transporter permease n=1 Tax=Xylanibacter oryzae TaxID=185293 RepID=UPI0004B465C3|nr:ABC transporter permease [Xylanibacter oryzae]
MGTIDITYGSLVIGLLLLLIPLYFFYKFGAKLVKSTIIAAARMVVQLFLIGLYLKYLFAWNSPLINLLWVMIMVFVASATATKRTGLKRKLVFIPLCVGLFTTALFVGLYFLIFVVHLEHPFEARYFIPIMGILMGNMLGVNVMALNTYYDGLQRERQLYYYLLGNGASHVEAIAPFVRQAMEKAFSPCIANMAVMGIVSLPGTMIGQILGGSDPDVAIKYQMLIIVITFTASMLSLMITIYFANKNSFDNYGRLLEVKKKY